MGQLDRALGLMQRHIAKNDPERWIVLQDSTSNTKGGPWSLTFPTNATTIDDILNTTSVDPAERSNFSGKYRTIPSLTVVNSSTSKALTSDVGFTTLLLPLKSSTVSEETREVKGTRVRKETPLSHLKEILNTTNNNLGIHTEMVNLFSEIFPREGGSTLDLTDIKSINKRTKSLDDFCNMISSYKLEVFEGHEGLPLVHTPAITMNAKRTREGFCVRMFLCGVEVDSQGLSVRKSTSIEFSGKYNPGFEGEKGKFFISRTDSNLTLPDLLSTTQPVKTFTSTAAIGNFSTGRDKTTILEPYTQNDAKILNALKIKFHDTHIPNKENMELHLIGMLTQFTNAIACFRYSPTTEELKMQSKSLESQLSDASKIKPGSAIFIESTETHETISRLDIQGQSFGKLSSSHKGNKGKAGKKKGFKDL